MKVERDYVEVHKNLLRSIEGNITEAITGLATRFKSSVAGASFDGGLGVTTSE